MSHSCGSQKSEAKESAVLVLSGGPEREFVLCLSLSFWSLPAILGVPWTVAVSLTSLPPLTRSLLFLSVSTFKCPSSYEDSSQWTRLHLTLHLKRRYF